MDKRLSARFTHRGTLVRVAAVAAQPLLSACGTSKSSPISTAAPVPTSAWLTDRRAATPTPPVLYFGANKGGMYALNRADGSLIWRHSIVSSIYSATKG